MTISAKILEDSITKNGDRLTTFELTYPRFIHAQLMTHRMFSRNASSSRAMPVRHMVTEALCRPAIPMHWGKNKPGMQATEEISGPERSLALEQWMRARDEAVTTAEALIGLGVHKQVANRVLEPFTHITVILTATDYGNWYSLRADDDAQPEIEALAKAMLAAHQKSKPTQRGATWHLPLVQAFEHEKFSMMDCVKFSVARCARVSYLNHDGTTPDPKKDLDLYHKLLESGHMSPFEHQAYPAEVKGYPSKNFRGWVQYRATLPGECRDQYPALGLDLSSQDKTSDYTGCEGTD